MYSNEILFFSVNSPVHCTIRNRTVCSKRGYCLGKLARTVRRKARTPGANRAAVNPIRTGVFFWVSHEPGGVGGLI